jgi:MFS family permease
MSAPADLAKRLELARFGVLLLLALALISAYLTRHCLAVANTTMQAELGFNNQQFGYLYGAFSVGYLFFQVPGGWLGQRWGTRVTMPLLSIFWSCAIFATALVTTLPALVATRFAFGLAQAGLIPNQAKVVNDWFPATSRGTTSAVIVMAMSIGSVASLWLTSWLMRFYDWRTVFHAYSLVGIAWAVLFFTLFRSRPIDVQWLRGAAETDRQEADVAAEAPPTPILLWRILASRNIWGLAGQMLFKAAGYNLFVTFFPAFLEFAYGTSREDAGARASWSLIGLVFGSLLGGRLVDRLQQRTGNKRISRCGVAMAALLLTALCMVAASLAVTGLQSAAVMAVAALFSGMAMPCPWAAAVDIGGENSAVVMGYINMGACLAGIVVTPLVGQLIDHIRATHGNWNLVIFLHAGFYLAAALCWLAVNPGLTINSAETRHAV